jgi:hypothetical protein
MPLNPLLMRLPVNVDAINTFYKKKTKSIRNTLIKRSTTSTGAAYYKSIILAEKLNV